MRIAVIATIVVAIVAIFATPALAKQTFLPVPPVIGLTGTEGQAAYANAGFTKVPHIKGNPSDIIYKITPKPDVTMPDNYQANFWTSESGEPPEPPPPTPKPKPTPTPPVTPTPGPTGGSGGTEITSGEGKSLMFTGFDPTLLLLIGGGLVGGGLYLRRR